MTALLKARLAEITAGERPTEVPNTSVDVQFNPTSLRVQISNRTAGGAQAGAQARQRPGTGEMSVGFDLVFDTADEDAGGGRAVNVLERTKMVERFVRPRGTQPGQEAPPRVLFEWGGFQVQGTMESANIDLDFFDAQGMPLRAKVAVSIKGQDPRWAYTPAPSGAGAGAGAQGGPQTPRGPGTAGGALAAGAPGTSGLAAAVDRIVQAMPGESLAQLAARAGFDPKAWRALASGVGDPLKLAMGQEVALPAHQGSSANGQAAQGQDSAATRAALALTSAAAPVAGAGGGGAASQRATPGVAAAASAANPVRAGQALAAQGGAQGSIAASRAQAHGAGAARSLAAFGITGIAAAEQADRPWGAGVPLRPRLGGVAAPPSRSTTPLATAQRSRYRPCGGGCGCRQCGGR